MLEVIKSYDKLKNNGFDVFFWECLTGKNNSEDSYFLPIYFEHVFLIFEPV